MKNILRKLDSTEIMLIGFVLAFPLTAIIGLNFSEIGGATTALIGIVTMIYGKYRQLKPMSEEED